MTIAMVTFIDVRPGPGQLADLVKGELESAASQGTIPQLGSVDRRCPVGEPVSFSIKIQWQLLGGDWNLGLYWFSMG